MEFSRPVTTCRCAAWTADSIEFCPAPGSRVHRHRDQGHLRATPGAEPLVMRVGISCTSVEGAAKNLAAEIPHWDFDASRARPSRSGARRSALLDADLPAKRSTETFYTDAYRGLVAPATFNDVDGTYRGQDRQNHPNPGFTKYTTLSIWDIYRGEVPFIMLMQPQRASDIVRTLVADYEQLGLHTLPMWPLWGNETWSMTGFHAAGMILGAYTRGFRDFDAEAAYAAIRDTALGARRFGPPAPTDATIAKRTDNGKAAGELPQIRLCADGPAWRIGLLHSRPRLRLLVRRRDGRAARQAAMTRQCSTSWARTTRMSTIRQPGSCAPRPGRQVARSISARHPISRLR